MANWDVSRLARTNPSDVADELNRLEARVTELLHANNTYQQEARDARAEIKAIAGVASIDSAKTLRESQQAIVDLLFNANYQVHGATVFQAVKKVLADLKASQKALDDAKQRIEVSPSYDDLNHARKDARKYGATLSLIREICTDHGIAPADGSDVKSTSDMVKELVFLKNPPAKSISELSEWDLKVENRLGLLERRVAEISYYSKPTEKPVELMLCESEKIGFKPGIYRFVVDPTCPRCTEMARRNTPPPAPRKK